MSDSAVLIPEVTGTPQAQIATNQVGGKQYQVVNLADSDGSVLAPLTDAQLRAAPIEISGSQTDGATATGEALVIAGVTAGGVVQVFETNGSGHLHVSDGGGSLTVDSPTLASEATLAEISGKIPTASAEMPAMNTASVPVRQAPQKYWDWSFADAISNNVDISKATLIRTGSGQTVNQTAGNLVLTSGTTVNAETVIRSLESWNGALTMWEVTTLSQRIANNNFFIELADVIGDGLAYNIVNTTTVDVTKTAHGFTAANIGQRIDLCALSSVGVPMEGVIASIPSVDTIRFTVAGWPASGSGTLSLTGWNKIELNYTGTSATALNFNTRRKGYQNTVVAATINTTATGSGHQAAVNVSSGVASLSDQVLTSAGVMTNRNAWKLNIPEPSTELYYQVRCRNGTTAPASTTTWTIGMLRVEDYIAQQVELTGTRQQSSGNSIPVGVIGTVPISGTVTATVTAGTVNPVVPATPYILNSAASTNEALILTGTSGLQAFYATNTGATVAFVKLYNKATAPTSSDVPAMILPVPAAVGGVAGVCTLPIGFSGFRFALGLGIRITGAVADNDTTAVAAGQVKVILSRTV